MNEAEQVVDDLPWDPLWEYILGDEDGGHDEESLTASLPQEVNQQSHQTKPRFWKPRNRDKGSLTSESEVAKKRESLGWWGSVGSGAADVDVGGSVGEESWPWRLDPFATKSSSSFTGPKEPNTKKELSLTDSRDDTLNSSFQNSIRSMLSWDNCPTEQSPSKDDTDRSSEARDKRELANTKGHSVSASVPTRQTTKMFWRRNRKDAQQQTLVKSGSTNSDKARNPFFRKSNPSSTSRSKSASPRKSRIFKRGEGERAKAVGTDVVHESKKHGNNTEEGPLAFEWGGDDLFTRNQSVFGNVSWSSNPSSVTSTQSESNTNLNTSCSDKDDRGESLSGGVSEQLKGDGFRPLQKLVDWIESSDTETDGGTTLEGSQVTEDSQTNESVTSALFGFKRSNASPFVSVRDVSSNNKMKQNIYHEAKNPFAVAAPVVENSRTPGRVESPHSIRDQPSPLITPIATRRVTSEVLDEANPFAAARIVGRASPALTEPSTQSYNPESLDGSRSTRFIVGTTTGGKTVTKKSNTRGLFKRALCRKPKTPEQQWVSSQRGTSYSELSPQELAQVFPKVRSVCDEQGSVSSSSVMLGSFDHSLPAHFQAELDISGPHSLFEYEYETGVHMHIAYNEFDQIELTPMKIESLSTPVPKPAHSKRENSEVIVQVEVSNLEILLLFQLIAAQASLVSKTDCIIRQGYWWGRQRLPQLPITPGVDAVGKLFSVDKTSQRRYNLNVGDRVLTLCYKEGGLPCGGNARYMAVDPDQLVKVPETIDPALAACLPETYLTAFQVLHLGQMGEDRYEPLSLKMYSILLVGKTISNEGRALSELGRLAGANVFALCPRAHFSKLVAMGIQPLDINSIDWWDSVSRTIDCIACIDDDVATIHYKLLKPSGRVVQIRSPSCGAIGSGVVPPIGFDKQRRRKGQHQQDSTSVYDVYEEWENNNECCKFDLDFLVGLLHQGRLKPKLLDRVSLNKVENAHELLTYKRLNGFIVCEPWLVAKSRAVLL